MKTIFMCTCCYNTFPFCQINNIELNLLDYCLSSKNIQYNTEIGSAAVCSLLHMTYRWNYRFILCIH